MQVEFNGNRDKHEYIVVFFYDEFLSCFQSFIIPVSVRVWDVNDNAPQWVGAPYRVRVSELTAVGTRILAPRATDADQPGPHATLHYSVVPGPHSVSCKPIRLDIRQILKAHSIIFLL